MVDAGIGRLLVASLHQGIADVAPARLPFYEHWLTPPGFSGGRFDLAPLHAVLSFLRREGQVSYEEIMRRAGACTAEWAFAEWRGWERTAVRRLPPAIRGRVVLYLSRRLVRLTFRGSRASARLRKGTATVTVHASIFCGVREPAGWPMCVFYSAAVEQLFRCFELDAFVDVTQCRASGGHGCTLAVTIRGPLFAAAAAA
jgi:hypothetical protein